MQRGQDGWRRDHTTDDDSDDKHGTNEGGSSDNDNDDADEGEGDADDEGYGGDVHRLFLKNFFLF